jgi:hypothetical protein
MPERCLAAIMFTDIFGYTALMGKDEKKAFEYLKKTAGSSGDSSENTKADS